MNVIFISPSITLYSRLLSGSYPNSISCVMTSQVCCYCSFQSSFTGAEDGGAVPVTNMLSSPLPSVGEASFLFLCNRQRHKGAVRVICLSIVASCAGWVTRYVYTLTAPQSMSASSCRWRVTVLLTAATTQPTVMTADLPPLRRPSPPSAASLNHGS